MTDTDPARGPAEQPGPGQPDRAQDAREAAMIRKVLRVQERHREGGVDPELADPEPAGPELTGSELAGSELAGPDR